MLVKCLKPGEGFAIGSHRLTLVHISSWTAALALDTRHIQVDPGYVFAFAGAAITVARIKSNAVTFAIDADESIKITRGGNEPV